MVQENRRQVIVYFVNFGLLVVSCMLLARDIELKLIFLQLTTNN